MSRMDTVTRVRELTSDVLGFAQMNDKKERLGQLTLLIDS